MKENKDEKTAMYVPFDNGKRFYRSMTIADVKEIKTINEVSEEVADKWSQVAKVMSEKMEKFKVGDMDVVIGIGVTKADVDNQFLDYNPSCNYLESQGNQYFFYNKGTSNGIGEVTYAGIKGNKDLGPLDYILVKNTLEIFLNKKKVKNSK